MGNITRKDAAILMAMIASSMKKDNRIMTVKLPSCVMPDGAATFDAHQECRIHTKRYERLTKYFLSDRTDMDDAIVGCNTQDELDAVVDRL